MAEGHKWRPLSDLPANPGEWEDHELDSLAHVWRLRKGALEGQEMIVAFNRELEREWAIETGIIEGVYTLDRGITQTLIERGIDASYIPHEATNRDPELVARIIQGHKEALEGIFAFVKGERELGTSYIRELHAALLHYVDKIVVFDQFGKPFETKLEKGEYKKLSNNPRREDGTLHEYCPPEHVSSEVDRLIALHREHRSRGVAPHIEAAWLHHSFTQIHPFQDGNGRVARALASLVLVRAALFPLVVTRDDRARYIDALEVADAGDLGPFVGLVSKLQRKTLAKAITHIADLKRVTSVEEALAVTRDVLVDLGRIAPVDRYAAKPNADRLIEITAKVLQDAASRLANEVTRVNTDYSFASSQGGNPSAGDLAFLARHLGYDPNPADYFRSAFLRFVTRTPSGPHTQSIVISFQTIGSVFQGSVGAVGYFQNESDQPAPLSSEVFIVDYREERSELEKRYLVWLDHVVINGLAEWRRRLA